MVGGCRNNRPPELLETELQTVSWSEFKKAALERIVERQSVIVTGDGDFAFIAIVLPKEDMRDRVVGIASQIEAGRDHALWP